jgi:hypothetical protein
MQAYTTGWGQKLDRGAEFSWVSTTKFSDKGSLFIHMVQSAQLVTPLYDYH